MDIEELNVIVRDTLREHLKDPLNRGIQWIFWGFPLTKIRYPMVTIFLSTTASWHKGIGLEPGRRVTYEITVASHKETRATINGEEFSGYRLTSYLVDKIIEVFKTQRQALLNKGIREIEFIRVEAAPYATELEEYLQSIFIEFMID